MVMTYDDFQAWCKIPGNPERLANAARAMCNLWITHGPDGKHMTDAQRAEYAEILELAEERGIDYHWLTMQHPRAMCGCQISLPGEEPIPPITLSPSSEMWDRWLRGARAEVERRR